MLSSSKNRIKFYELEINLYLIPFLCLLIFTSNVGSAENNNLVALHDDVGGLFDSSNNLNLEKSIAAVFNRVAYGSTTTTKRSIPDSVYVHSLTTVPTPSLTTTFRYREKDREVEYVHTNNENPRPHLTAANRNYGQELERDHVLPTSAPNADILKSNSNPTYPNPNRHHGHDRHNRHPYPTPYPSGHIRKGPPTNPMYTGDLPSYSPPSRVSFTPPLPPNLTNPFAETPTLRGTNSDGSVATFINRRPIPPPSIMPGHERVPQRPPDVPNPNDHPEPPKSDGGRKKTLNVAQDKNEQMVTERIDSNSNSRLFQLDNNNSNNNNTSSSDILPNGIHFPSISRILSGSNGRKQSVPDVLLRSVTISPPAAQSTVRQMQTTTTARQINLTEISVSNNSQDEITKLEEIFEGEEATTTTPTSIISSSSAIIQTMANINLKSVMEKTNTTDRHLSRDEEVYRNNNLSTWTIWWNIHIYLSAILFTIIAVYSIFKMIFYDKLTHLFSQSYFISIHLILILICLLRIFYLCYDAYNIHLSFSLFGSEILLNLPLTLLTITFSILILFLLLRSINQKANRYSSIIRPLTVIIFAVVHIFLCITLHYVESREMEQFMQHQNLSHSVNLPPRVLSLICQMIYIFICLSLGILYLYIYRYLTQTLGKAQNYIHGYRNLSYALHITIATALLFILLAALQIYGAFSIGSHTKLKMNNSGSNRKGSWMSHVDIDWIQWGYQFSLRFLEIVIIALISWVTGIKIGTMKVVQREKDFEQTHPSGFALFPCTATSSQEQFDSDYPANCNANSNLHNYTMRTGKPIYDENFALNTFDCPIKNREFIFGASNINDFHPSLETSSLHSNSQNNSNNNSGIGPAEIVTSDYLNENQEYCLNDSGNVPDHYENPNFELVQHQKQSSDLMNTDYSIQSLCSQGNNPKVNYDPQMMNSRNEFRASKNLKVMKNISNFSGDGTCGKSRNLLTHNHNNQQYSKNYNDPFERQIPVRRSTTVNTIGGVHGVNPYSRTDDVSISSNSSISSNRGRLLQAAMLNSRPQQAQTLRYNDHNHHHHHYHHNYRPGGPCFEDAPPPSPHLPLSHSDGIIVQPPHENSDSMLVDDQGFVRFRDLDQQR